VLEVVAIQLLEPERSELRLPDGAKPIPVAQFAQAQHAAELGDVGLGTRSNRRATHYSATTMPKPPTWAAKARKPCDWGLTSSSRMCYETTLATILLYINITTLGLAVAALFGTYHHGLSVKDAEWRTEWSDLDTRDAEAKALNEATERS
jgi:hypothetical protein